MKKLLIALCLAGFASSAVLAADAPAGGDAPPAKHHHKKHHKKHHGKRHHKAAHPGGAQDR